MLKQSSRLEVQIEGKIYALHCDSDSPLGSLHDALMQMKGWCVERMTAAQKEEEKICEEIKENDAKKCQPCEEAPKEE